MMTDWKEIGRLEEIPPLGTRTVKSEAGDIAVFRTSHDRVFALLDRCPHKGGPLSQGIVHGDRVTCPLHEWKIALDSGEALPPDEGCTRRFPTRMKDGVIYLKY